MCGRYALALRPSEVRRQLEHAQMSVDDAPDDDSVRQSYNFAPGYHGLVYRADGTMHRLQVMKWGLVPCWTKRTPAYGSTMKTINCRDDSLYEDRGMWTSMKKKKRCVVVAQGFYEWLKKDGSKEKTPHFTKHKDGRLMCFAGLYDCVQLEDSEEKLYTYTIITTGSNKQLEFLHDRMPVILGTRSEDVKTWLDPDRSEWSAELQSLLRPYEGELECYVVSKEVGKVGNNSAQFVVPVDSAANKSNIANFFGRQRVRQKEEDMEGKGIKRERHEAEEEGGGGGDGDGGGGDRPQQKRTKRAVGASPQTRSATSNGSAGGRRRAGQTRIESFFGG